MALIDLQFQLICLNSAIFFFQLQGYSSLWDGMGMGWDGMGWDGDEMGWDGI